MRCENCGSENPEDDYFCGNCGAGLSPLGSGGWSKTYGIPGFWTGTISDGMNGPRVQTRFSIIGFDEVTTYPRWMLTMAVWVGLAMIVLVGLLTTVNAISDARLGQAVIGVVEIAAAILTGYAIYRLFYAPPRLRTR